MKAIILDLDNTISDDAWRIKHIDWTSDDPMTRYNKYHSLAPFDSVGNKELFEGVGHSIFVFTARPVQHRIQTEHWLQMNGISPMAVYMRHNNDHRHSAELKLSQLAWMLCDFGLFVGDIAGAYDDRPEVIEAYKKAGIVNAHVRSIHDQCAYTKPRMI